MKNELSCVGIPVLVVIIFFQVGSNPVYGFGSQTRGLFTFWITWVSLMVGMLMVNSAFKRKLQGEGLDFWKMTGALILAIPALFQILWAH
jgi:hypothetical protein